MAQPPPAVLGLLHHRWRMSTIAIVVIMLHMMPRRISRATLVTAVCLATKRLRRPITRRLMTAAAHGAVVRRMKFYRAKEQHSLGPKPVATLDNRPRSSNE